MLAFPLAVIMLAAQTLAPADRPRASTASRVPTTELYALAVARLLGDESADSAWVVPTAALGDLNVRQRAGAGPAQRASIAEARRVVARLSRSGRHPIRGVRATLGRDDALQLVLGEVRVEPPMNPTFARLRIGVVGRGGERRTLEFLLKREASGWRVLNMEDADSIG